MSRPADFKLRWTKSFVGKVIRQQHDVKGSRGFAPAKRCPLLRGDRHPRSGPGPVPTSKRNTVTKEQGHENTESCPTQNVGKIQSRL